jgi:RHS repeat-associated protein
VARASSDCGRRFPAAISGRRAARISAKVTVNASGASEDHTDYTAFGVIISQSSTSAQGRFCWTSKDYDAQTGLQYNLARYYSPATGTWTSQDPMGFGAGSTDLYQYAGNDSMNATDPSGNIIVFASSREAYAFVQKMAQVYDARHIFVSRLSDGRWYAHLDIRDSKAAFAYADAKWRVYRRNQSGMADFSDRTSFLFAAGVAGEAIGATTATDLDGARLLISRQDISGIRADNTAQNPDRDFERPLFIDIGGEGRYSQALNVNPFSWQFYNPNVRILRLIRALGQSLPFPDQSVYQITLESTPIFTETVDEMIRVIQPGGKIALVTPELYARALIQRLIDGIIAKYGPTKVKRIRTTLPNGEGGEEPATRTIIYVPSNERRIDE